MVGCLIIVFILVILSLLMLLGLDMISIGTFSFLLLVGGVIFWVLIAKYSKKPKTVKPPVKPPPALDKKAPASPPPPVSEKYKKEPDIVIPQVESAKSDRPQPSPKIPPVTNQTPPQVKPLPKTQPSSTELKPPLTPDKKVNIPVEKTTPEKPLALETSLPKRPAPQIIKPVKKEKKDPPESKKQNIPEPTPALPSEDSSPPVMPAKPVRVFEPFTPDNPSESSKVKESPVDDSPADEIPVPKETSISESEKTSIVEPSITENSAQPEDTPIVESDKPEDSPMVESAAPSPFTQTEELLATDPIHVVLNTRFIKIRQKWFTACVQSILEYNKMQKLPAKQIPLKTQALTPAIELTLKVIQIHLFQVYLSQHTFLPDNLKQSLLNSLQNLIFADKKETASNLLDKLGNVLASHKNQSGHTLALHWISETLSQHLIQTSDNIDGISLIEQVSRYTFSNILLETVQALGDKRTATKIINQLKANKSKLAPPKKPKKKK